MANVVLVVLSLTIGFFFILVGTLKISPVISDEVYREMRKIFIRSAKVFPLYAQTGLRPDPHMYRRIVGTTEVICGIILAIVPGPLKQVANLILFCIMCGACYTHSALKDPMERMTPCLIFGLLLGCRFIVHIQVHIRESRQLAEAEKEAREAQEAVTAEDKKTQ